MNDGTYDAAVVGGSFSGMSAALQLARAKRRVVIVDDNTQINARVRRSYGFLGSDGVPPAEIARNARQQIMQYENVTWISDRVNDIDGTKDRFRLSLLAGSQIQSRRVILACGIKVNLPPIPGLKELWGDTVFNCPYCHAYEHSGSRLAILRLDEPPIYEALLYPDWGNITLLMNGEHLSERDAKLVAQRGVTVEQRRIASFKSPCSVVYEDGRMDSFSALFLNPPLEVPSLVENIGCEVLNNPKKRVLKVDLYGHTSQDGIYGCGTLASGNATISEAVAKGASVGKAVHSSFYFKTTVT